MGSTIGAGDDFAPSCVGGAGGEDVSHTWTVPMDGTYVINTDGSDFDTILLVEEGLCANGLEIDCDDDAGMGTQSQLKLALTAGQELTIVVDGFNDGAAGNYVLNISEFMCPPAFDLGGMVPVIQMGMNLQGPSAIGGSCGGDGAPESVFTWTAPADGNYDIDTFGSNFDTLLYVFDGTCGGTELGCNDDNMGTTSLVNVNLVAGQVIYIVVDGFGANFGNWTLNITQN
jgi:hypothetical protein